MIRIAVTWLIATVFVSHAWSQNRKLPTETNGLGMQLKLLPAGRYERGSRSTNPPFAKDHAEYSDQDANHRHQVVLTRPFYLATTEVTRGQFAKFVKATGYKTSATSSGTGIVGWDPTPAPENPRHKQSFRQREEFSWQHPGFEQDDDHPVVGVSFRDALAFCQWLSDEEGKAYRLPTEAEWEYAARAGTSTAFSFGNAYRGIIEQHANVAHAELERVAPDRVMRQWIVYPQTEKGDGFAFTSPVGNYAANPFGLHDMHGNVWEWCQDKYLETFYKRFGSTGHHKLRNRAIDPINNEDWNDTGDWRVIRGGCWFTSPVQARSSCRSYFEADDATAYVGFRVAMDAPKSETSQARRDFETSESAREELHELTGGLRERRTGIVTIIVNDQQLTDEFFDAVADLSEPVDIEVNARGKLTGVHIAQLARAKDLRGLILSGTGNGITDEDLAPIGNKTELEILQVTGTVGLSDGMMRHLGKLENLQSLSLHGDGITDTGLSKLPSLAHIRTIHISGTQGTGAVLEKVASGELTDFQCNHFRDEDFEHLQPVAESLKTLRLSGDLSDDGIQDIAKLRQLLNLTIRNCPQLTDQGLQVLGQLPFIRSLDLSDTAAGDLTIDAVAENNWLYDLQIGSAALTNRGIMRMSEMVGLGDLAIVSDESEITDDAFAHFWRMRNLRAFRLVAPNITGETLGPLAECPKLDRVSISGESINDSGIECLSQLRHLRHATVGGYGDAQITKVTSNGLLKLAALPSSVRLTLRRHNLKLDDDAFDQLKRTATHLELSAW